MLTRSRLSAAQATLSAALLLGVTVPALAGSGVRPPRLAPALTAPRPTANPDDEFSAASDNRPKTLDPLEVLNRGIFAVNHQVYRFLLRPLARVTEAVIPKTVLTRIGYVFDNFETPVRVVSSLLQANFSRAGKETGKLLINSTVGVGGLMRPSDRFACLADVPDEDVSQAFGKWGIPQGPYVVLPILGPSSLRDLTGKAADIALNPTIWVGSNTLRYSLTGTRNVQLNPRRIKAYDLAREGALDQYLAVRESYLSYRAEAVRR
jgi:phospholipid-binding lipoprotein MlaA